MKPSRRAAFTIAEILVVLFLSAIIIAVVSESFLSQASMNRKAERVSQALEAAIALERTISRDLRSVVATPGEAPLDISDDGTRIAFTTLAHGSSTLEETVYELVATDGGLRFERNGRPLFPNPVAEVRFELLRRGAAALVLVHLDVPPQGGASAPEAERALGRSSFLVQMPLPFAFLGSYPGTTPVP